MCKTGYSWGVAALLVFLVSGRPSLACAQERETSAPFAPRTYVAYRVQEAIAIDGKLNEAAWVHAEWTEAFVDIEGSEQPEPRLETRAKMLWDDQAFYVIAQLEEPDVWATFTKRDTAVYRDNAFEVFIDPDGDTHHYYEVEINALETVWDLMLVKPFRDGGPSFSAWDIRGLEAAVHVEGTLNEPEDTDEGWTVELALPWAVLREAAPGGRPPEDGAQWRLNFARAQWPFDVIDGAYHKATDPETGRPTTQAHWWVWAPQGSVNMHRPEYWGYVQFSEKPIGGAPAAFAADPNGRVKWALRRLYYRQRAYHDAHDRYADDLSALRAGDLSVEGLDFVPKLQTTQSTYEITAPGEKGATVHIRHDGKVWTTVAEKKQGQ